MQLGTLWDSPDSPNEMFLNLPEARNLEHCRAYFVLKTARALSMESRTLWALPCSQNGMFQETP